MKQRVDPVMVAIVGGLLEWIVKEMTTIMERTSRSAIFKLARDFSDTLFDGQCRQVVQGEDLPLHIGAMIFACRHVADSFGPDIHPGDMVYHNDPATGGSHLQDMCVFKPVFYEDELVFWCGNKAHMIDTGGSTPGGYHPQAEEIYQEGIRIPPVKIYERGKERADVIKFIMANVRYARMQRSDMAAQIAAVTSAEKNLLAILQKYGKETVKDCLEELYSMAEHAMRAVINSWPDGVYEGSSWMEGSRGRDDVEIKAKITIEGDEIAVDLYAPEQTKDYQNSYVANTMAAVYQEIMVFAGLKPPFNDGTYRPIRVNLGPPGTVVNATLPAACSQSTHLPHVVILDAMRSALSKVVLPERLHAGWGRPTTTGSSGVNPKDNTRYSHFHVLATSSGGSGAVAGMDGWVLAGEGSAGAIRKECIEDIESEYPIFVHRCEYRIDSGGAGKWRGAVGQEYEFEAVGHPQLVTVSGAGHKYLAMSVGGAKSRLIEPKLGLRYVVSGGEEKPIQPGSEVWLSIGEKFLVRPPGGGGVGDPFERDPEMVRQDVINQLVSIEGAREDYGVVIDPETLQVDVAATRKARGH